jgi:hypothetical protein
MSKEIDLKLIEFFKKNPNPPDKAVHRFAEMMGMDEHKFEEKIYKLLGSFASKGEYNKKNPKTLDKKELSRGMEVEMEHTSSPAISRRIAEDHLAEIPDYYTRLDKMEAAAEKELEKRSSISSMFKKLIKSPRKTVSNIVNKLKSRIDSEKLKTIQAIEFEPFYRAQRDTLKNPIVSLAKIPGSLYKDYKGSGYKSDLMNSLSAANKGYSRVQTLKAFPFSGIDFGHRLINRAHRFVVDKTPGLRKWNTNVSKKMIEKDLKKNFHKRLADLPDAIEDYKKLKRYREKGVGELFKTLGKGRKNHKGIRHEVLDWWTPTQSEMMARARLAKSLTAAGMAAKATGKGLAGAGAVGATGLIASRALGGKTEKKASFWIGFKKTAAQLIGSDPLKPQKDLVTPEMNKGNKSIIEGVRTNKNHQEQITNKKQPPKAQFKHASAAAIAASKGIVPKITSGVYNFAKKYAPNFTKGFGKLWNSGIGTTMAKAGLPGAGSHSYKALANKAKGLATKAPGVLKPYTFGQAATEYGTIKGLDWGINKAMNKLSNVFNLGKAVTKKNIEVAKSSADKIKKGLEKIKNTQKAIRRQKMRTKNIDLTKRIGEPKIDFQPRYTGTPLLDRLKGIKRSK